MGLTPINNAMNSKRINGNALEQIMNDVLSGMTEFTHQSCRYCHAADLEIISIEKGHAGQQESAVVLAFPLANRKA
jgi:hypothetical protein